MPPKVIILDHESLNYGKVAEVVENVDELTALVRVCDTGEQVRIRLDHLVPA